MTPTRSPAVELRGIHKHYDKTHVVRGVDLTLPEHAFLVLLGPSGCGKSTLLRMLAGLEAPSQGSLSILGREVANGVRGVVVEPGQRKLGLVFQSYALWPHMTVQQNVEWPLKIAKRSPEARRARVHEVLSLMGIEPLAQRYPNEISGGQQQRVAIARMLSPAPQLLLFDEPLSNLDAKLRVEMRSELLRVHRTTGATSVYVTHDQIEAMTMATHVAVMKDGLVEQFGTPQQLVDDPQSVFVATFLGTPAANVIEVSDQGGQYHFRGVALQPTVVGHAAAQLMYRAGDLKVVDAQSAPCAVLPCTLVEIAPMAGRFVCSVMAGETRLSVLSEVAPPLSPGDAIDIGFAPRASSVFDAAGAKIFKE